MHKSETTQKKKGKAKENQTKANKNSKMTLGDQLLEKEFQRKKDVEDLLAKHQEDKNNPQQEK
ncbi:hypothetical protein NEF87_000155 [Candidatus Lokiarchaeum ossiferum]|uniref:Uncharacterized protein n=1 Tax=Candidatus Lokiarchaeum ossiferum TaxID=2951803 RepID=A0ABY6HK20_9ARCH|nr:hypothetical protein NEF87_000155 [Candidatus Lokiarchaeum sp. B-35]